MFEALMGLFGVHAAEAAANATLINAANDVSTATQENVLGILGSATVVTWIGIGLAITIGLAFLFKLSKRAVR